MKNLILFIAALCSGIAQAQDKPQVTVNKMTDTEYKKLDDAASLMQKKAEEYRKAADDYDKTKQDILGKYNATEEPRNCNGDRKIVDVRGPYIIVEMDYHHTSGLIPFGTGCLTFATEVGSPTLAVK